MCIIVNEKLRYKVGITTNTLRDRLAQESVLWEEIVVGKGTLLECFNLEQQIHDLMDDKKDKSFNGSDMAGYTEIFDFDDDEVESVKELIVESLQ
ncbi:GIY-YIG nuclease family protein [Shewanella frigidimarina]|uniref:GIY-YIG nuclease family protein n=1 Tax=Shewanella frigidimarina TaxID=56812 RepID=UPI003D7A370F